MGSARSIATLDHARVEEREVFGRLTSTSVGAPPRASATKSVKGAAAVGAAVLTMVLPAVATAAPVPSTPATPTLQGPIPRTATSIPVGTAELPGAAESVDLSR